MLNSFSRKASLIFITVILFVVLFTPQSTNAAISGAYTNLNNQQVAYSSYNNRMLLIEAFATDCSYCRDQHPELVKFNSRFSSDIFLISVSVSADDTIPVITNYLQEYPASWEVGIDTGGSFANQFGIRSTPTMIFFDGNGNALDTKIGFTSYDELASTMEYFLEFDDPFTAPPHTYIPPEGPEGSFIEELFGSPIFGIAFFGIIVIMVYLKMTGGTNPGT